MAGRPRQRHARDYLYGDCRVKAFASSGPCTGMYWNLDDTRNACNIDTRTYRYVEQVQGNLVQIKHDREKIWDSCRKCQFSSKALASIFMSWRPSTKWRGSILENIRKRPVFRSLFLFVSNTVNILFRGLRNTQEGNCPSHRCMY